MSIAISNIVSYNSFQSELQNKIDVQFPVIFGVKESWADLTFFVESEEAAFEASLAAAQAEADSNVSTKTLRNRRKRQRAKEAKAKRKAKEEIGWNAVKVVKSTKAPSPQKQIRGDTLIMKNLPSDASQSEIINKLGRHGNIKFVKLIHDNKNNCKGIGFVRFVSRNVASDVYSAISTFRYKGCVVKMEIV